MAYSLLQQETAADTLYGFPAGTMAALGTSESSQGTNMGGIGNIFQVVSSTAANPGYGLSSVDGNSATSAGGYLNGIWQSLGGSMSVFPQAISQYQGGAAPNAAMSSFLASQGMTPASGGASNATGGTAASPATWFSDLTTWIGGYASRGALILLAIFLLLGAVYLFALRTQATESAA